MSVEQEPDPEACRVASVVYGALIPAVWCAIVAVGPDRPEFRGGDVGDLDLSMLLGGAHVGFVIAPIAAAIGGVLVAAYQGAARVARGVVVRAALGLGVVSGIGWCVIASISEEAPILVPFGSALALLVLYELLVPERETLARHVAAALGFKVARRERRTAHARADAQWIRAWIVFLGLALLVPILLNATTLFLLLVVPPIFALCAGAPVGLGIACTVLLRDARRARGPEGRAIGRPDLPWLALLTPIAAAAIAGWRRAVQAAIDQYAALPPPPEGDCYVATAASRGHARFVGARVLPVRGGVRRVSGQLLTLKAGELALKAAAPRLHRALRQVYDRVGPPIARRITTPWRADLAYLSLVPLELATRGALATLRRP